MCLLRCCSLEGVIHQAQCMHMFMPDLHTAVQRSNRNNNAQMLVAMTATLCKPCHCNIDRTFAVAMQVQGMLRAAKITVTCDQQQLIAQLLKQTSLSVADLSACLSRIPKGSLPLSPVFSSSAPFTCKPFQPGSNSRMVGRK